MIEIEEFIISSVKPNWNGKFYLMIPRLSNSYEKFETHLHSNGALH